ncbi:MAG TPA: cobalamin/Fe3+-siderophore ABC transporter ATP-binding protein [Phycisphaerales bacterium]|nr:cobalamin/Fe3+-siderophore ABC transporter ATP-binding protein [Phycisphaerales bacterium]HCD33578.1 cobalamin/Fe3+-siderophore ABC transporter ATP-binding protein [Phycisphaerales bacterium]|tara:strand:- start:42133 stop:42960 length:828 start_codon:yes stop_codon:yes gene_type:complete
MSDAVVFENVSLTRNQTPILRDVSFTLAKGTCSAILGPNGSGKTTITRAIAGTMFPTSGKATVLGNTLGQCNIIELRKRIGIVNPSTDSADYHSSGAVVDSDLSAIDAVCTGYFGTIGLYETPTSEQRDHAEHLLKQVGLSHRLAHRLNLLSTGEKRRCLIARAMALKPELLILDEPTAGMDVAGREQIIATVQQILHKPDAPTVLFITHHVEELPPTTSKVLLIRDGQITADGKPDDVITPESLTEVYGCKVFVRKIHGRFWLEVLPEAWLDLI